MGLKLVTNSEQNHSSQFFGFVAPGLGLGLFTHRARRIAARKMSAKSTLGTQELFIFFAPTGSGRRGANLMMSSLRPNRCNAKKSGKATAPSFRFWDFVHRAKI